MKTIDGMITKTKEKLLPREDEVTYEEDFEDDCPILPLIRGRMCNDRLCSPGPLGYRTMAVNHLAAFSSQAIRQSKRQTRPVNPKDL